MPDKFVVPISADLLTSAHAAMSDSGSNDAEHDALVELVDSLEERRPFDQLLNDAAELLLEFHDPSYRDREGWRDAMNMLVNVAGYLATRPADQPPLNDLDTTQRLAVLRDAIAHGWSDLDAALAYSPYFTDAVFAGFAASDEVTA